MFFEITLKTVCSSGEKVHLLVLHQQPRSLQRWLLLFVLFFLLLFLMLYCSLVITFITVLFTKKRAKTKDLHISGCFAMHANKNEEHIKIPS